MGTFRWRAKFIFGVFCVGTFSLITACAPGTSQEKSLTRIQSQISVLSTEMREAFLKSEEERISLYKKLNGDVKLLQKNQADTSSISDELRASLIAIGAKLDEYNKRMENLSERLNLVETILTERMTFLSDQVSEIGRETTISPGSSPVQRQSPTPDTTIPSQQSSDTELEPEASQFYHTAYLAYVNGDFDTAIAGFEKYLELYPNTELADIAQYWIAESFFSLGEFETSLTEYDKFIAQYPESDKIPAAYLSKADVYLQLGRQLEAISHLKYIINQFPESDAARQAEERLRALGE